MSAASTLSSIPMPVQIVVFDLGGVVVQICRSLKEAGARVGIDVPDSDITPEQRLARKAVHALYERGHLVCDEFFVQIAKTSGGRYAPSQFKAMHEAWIIGEYPGVSSLIDDLHGAGLHTGVLSNTNAAHWAQMQPTVRADGSIAAPKFQTPGKPRHKFASHLMGFAKPDRAIYDAFAKATGYAPGSILFFDDLPDNVAAARSAGWKAHQIDHTGDPAAQMREHLGMLGII